MLYALANYKNKRLNHRQIIILCIHLKMQFCMLMNAYCIFYFQFVKLIIRHSFPFKVPALCHSRYFYIFPVCQCLCQIIFIDDILKRLILFIYWRGSHLKTKNRLQFVYCFFRCVSMISVSLVHKYDEVIQ